MGMNIGIRTWPWFLGATLALLAGCFYPPILEWMLSADESTSRWCNSLVGRNRAVDITISLLNTRMADVLLIIGYVTVFTLHACRPANSTERLKRGVFWIVTVLAFGIVYSLQQTIEGSVSRDSPGRVLSGWYDLRNDSDIEVKVSKSFSFPSGHASTYFFFAFMAMREFRRMGLALFVLALALPSTRIVTGAHWPTDILGSFLLMGLIAGLLVETRLGSAFAILTRMSGDLLRVFRDRGNRRISERLRSAWRAFVGDAPEQPSGPSFSGPSDPPRRPVERTGSSPVRYKDN